MNAGDVKNTWNPWTREELGSLSVEPGRGQLLRSRPRWSPVTADTDGPAMILESRGSLLRCASDAFSTKILRCGHPASLRTPQVRKLTALE